MTPYKVKLQLTQQSWCPTNNFHFLLNFCSVDRGSPAEKAGFKVGDQLMEVNGKNFENLRHKEAVEFIKSQKHIMVTLKVTFKRLLSHLKKFIWLGMKIDSAQILCI